MPAFRTGVAAAAAVTWMGAPSTGFQNLNIITGYWGFPETFNIPDTVQDFLIAAGVEEIAGGQTIELGLITETESPLPLILRKTIVLGLVTETESALTTSVQKTVNLGLVTEVESALGIIIDTGANCEPVFLGTGSYSDRMMAGLVSQGFLVGSMADRERLRLLCKLAIGPFVNLSLHDLYFLAGEEQRMVQ